MDELFPDTGDELFDMQELRIGHMVPVWLR